MSTDATKSVSPAPARSAFQKKKTKDPPHEVIGREERAKGVDSPQGAAGRACSDFPTVLRQIAETTRDALREEAVQAFSQEQCYIRRYIDQQMHASFREQLHHLKLQLSDFIRDFLEVKSTELVSMSMSRESLRAEQELREMQSVVDGLQQSVSRLVGRSHGSSPRPPIDTASVDATITAKLAQNDKAIAEITAQNAALTKILTAQQEQLSELRGCLGGISDTELNGIFGDEVNFSIIKKQRDDTLAEEWLPTEMGLAQADSSPRYLTTSLSSRPTVVSTTGQSPYLPARTQEEYRRPSVLPLSIGRERLQEVLPHLNWESISEREFVVDGNRIITDPDANPVIDDNGNLVKITDAELEALVEASPS